MKYGIELGECHASLEPSTLGGHVKVVIEEAYGGGLDTVTFHATPQDMDTLRDAVTIIAREDVARCRLADLRAFANLLRNRARAAADPWLKAYYDRLTTEAEGLMEKAWREAEQAKQELGALEAMRPKAAETAVAR